MNNSLNFVNLETDINYAALCRKANRICVTILKYSYPQSGELSTKEQIVSKTPINVMISHVTKMLQNYPQLSRVFHCLSSVSKSKYFDTKNPFVTLEIKLSPVIPSYPLLLILYRQLSFMKHL